MPDLNSVQFFDPKPYFTKGGQGKLFRDPKPTEEHRYQRGYTPERMGEVHEAMGSIPTKVGPPHLFAHFRETLARSTAPTETLEEQVSAIHLSPSTLGSNRFVAGETATSMRPSGLSQTTGASRITMFHGSRGDPVLGASGKTASRSEIMGASTIHEIGHAHHALTDPSDFIENPSGHRERVADRFMEEHYRPDPREVRRGTSLAPEDFTYAATSQNKRFPGYKGWAPMQRAAQEREHARKRAMDPNLDFVAGSTGERWTHTETGKQWLVQGALFGKHNG